MCSPASFETAYVQRASPTEPVAVICPSRTLYACGPKTSLVEKSTSRSSVCRVASAASSTLYVPIRFTRIVRTGLSRTVSTPAIAAAWTMWVAPRASSRTASASSTSPWTKVRFGCSASSVPESASRWRLSSATISLSSTSCRARVVAMKPAPPVTKIRFPRSTRRVYPGNAFPPLAGALHARVTVRHVRRIPLVVVLLALLGIAGSAGGGVPIPPPPGDQLPTWSPDGSVIVFLSDRDGTSLRVMNPDGSGEHRIPWLPANTNYSFSHDWSHVAAYVDGQLVVERLDSSDRRSLGRATYLARASWSPDGTRVAFTAPSARPNEADVLVARIDGTETHRVAVGFSPTWAPTGDRIAYLAGPYGKNELHLANADGSGDVRIASGGAEFAPRRSPDGSRLGFIHHRR